MNQRSAFSLKTLVHFVKYVPSLSPFRLRSTHNLTQNRKKAMEPTEQRGWESSLHRTGERLKALETSKPHLEAQLITRRSQVQVLSPQP